MIITGVIATIIGLASAIYGIVMKNSAEYAIASFFGSDEIIMVDIALYAGIAVVVIGVLLLALGIKKNKQ